MREARRAGKCHRQQPDRPGPPVVCC